MFINSFFILKNVDLGRKGEASLNSVISQKPDPPFTIPGQKLLSVTSGPRQAEDGGKSGFQISVFQNKSFPNEGFKPSSCGAVELIV